jgi:hypothetical protein
MLMGSLMPPDYKWLPRRRTKKRKDLIELRFRCQVRDKICLQILHDLAPQKKLHLGPATTMSHVSSKLNQDGKIRKFQNFHFWVWSGPLQMVLLLTNIG